MYGEFCRNMDCFSEEYFRKNKNSGYLRITLRDEIIYENFIGMADFEKGIEFKRDSAFTLYSISKPFCTLGLMKLRDRNMVDIALHPSKYLPEAKGFDPSVTIAQLLNHTSGLPDFVQTAKFNEKYAEGRAEDMRKQLIELAEYPQVFEPGTAAMYANINFIVCAIIIENVTGMKYADYMQKEVFEPLGAKSAAVDNPELFVKNRVTGYELENGERIPAERTLDWMFGAGDIIGTADDVYCLNKAIKHRLLFKEETWDEILTPSPLNSMGFGCRVDSWYGRKRITHNGGSRGFRTLHMQLPEEDFDIIFLSNAGWGNARNDFAEAIYTGFFGEVSAEREDKEMDVGYI